MEPLSRMNKLKWFLITKKGVTYTEEEIVIPGSVRIHYLNIGTPHEGKTDFSS